MQALSLAYSLSGAAGIRASWAMLVIACSVHFGFLHPAAYLMWVGSWWTIILALLFSVAEFLGDKIPALDHAVHAINLALAPLVGAISGMSAYHGSPAAGAILGVLGGANALGIHSAKTALRAASSVATLGIANPVISIIEDLGATTFIIIALLVPALTALVLAIATIWLFRKARRLIASRRQKAI